MPVTVKAFSAYLSFSLLFQALSVLAASASASTLVTYPTAPYAVPYYHGGLVAYANGAVVPVKTPEVQAGEAAHFAAKGVAAPLSSAAGPAHYAWHYGYPGLTR